MKGQKSQGDLCKEISSLKSSSRRTSTDKKTVLLYHEQELYSLSYCYSFVEACHRSSAILKFVQIFWMPTMWWNFPIPWDYRWEGEKHCDYFIEKVRLQAMLSGKKKYVKSLTKRVEDSQCSVTGSNHNFNSSNQPLTSSFGANSELYSLFYVTLCLFHFRAL